MPIAPFPHQYVVTSTHDELLAPPRQRVRTGPPVQFGGSDQVWSPEELLIGAALSCLETTFAAYARRAGLEVHGWAGTGVGTLVKAPGGPVFTTIDLAIELMVDPGQELAAEQLLLTAERACIVARALAVPVHVIVTFAAPHQLAAG